MFSKSGYISAPDFFHIIYVTISRQDATGDKKAADLRHEAELAFMGFLLKHQKGCVLSPHGELFEVGPRFLTEQLASDVYPRCFDIYSGLVGRYGRETTQREQNRRTFGAFLFCASAALVAIAIVLVAEFLLTDAPPMAIRATYIFGLTIGFATLGAFAVSLNFSGALAWFRFQQNDVQADWAGYSVVFERQLADEYIAAEVSSFV